MSCYEYQKILRIPFDKLDISELTNQLDLALVEKNGLDYSLENNFTELFKYKEVGYFQFAWVDSDEDYIDYILDSKFDPSVQGDYGRSRNLTENEKKKYLLKFQELDPNVDMDDVRLVEYCWYNGTEAPDYYLVKDLFYDEV